MRNKRRNIKYIIYIIKGKQKATSTEDAKMCEIDESTIDGLKTMMLVVTR